MVCLEGRYDGCMLGCMFCLLSFAVPGISNAVTSG